MATGSTNVRRSPRIAKMRERKVGNTKKQQEEKEEPVKRHKLNWGQAETDMDIFTQDGAPELVQDLDNFIWSEEIEPHRDNRKVLLKKYGRGITGLIGHEWRTKYIVVALMSLQIYLAYYFRVDGMYGGTWLFWLTAYCVGGTVTQSLFLAAHEIAHNNAFKKLNHNKLFGIFTNMPLTLPFFIAFKGYHMDHHKYQGDKHLDTDIPTALEARLLSSLPGKLFFLFNQTWFYAMRPLFVKAQPFTNWHALNFAVQVCFNALIVKYFGWGSFFYLLASAHCAGSLHPIASHFIAEHYVFAEGAETHSYYGWMNYLCFNVGYHNEHHDFPNVAWSNLPKLRAVADEEYKKLPYHKSWVKVLIRFITDPRVSLYNRMLRDKK